MGSDKSHFDVSLIVRDKVIRHRPQLLKGKESRSGFEPRPLRLPLDQSGSQGPLGPQDPGPIFSQVHCRTAQSESRRHQEEGSELDSQEEVSPEETKSREVVLGYRERELDFFCFSCFPTAELRTASL